MSIKAFSLFLNIILGMGLLCLIIWLVIQDIDPDGYREIEYSLENKSNLVTGPEPAARILGEFEDQGIKYWEAFIDPIYFDLYIPRLYNSITMEVVYRVHNQQILEFGGLGTDEGWNFTFRPGENELLNNLDWSCNKFNKVKICKNPDSTSPELTYQNIDEFWRQLNDEKIILYFSPRPKNYEYDYLNLNTDLSLYDYLITEYDGSEDFGNGWRRRKAFFSSEDLWLAGHKYKFILSAPELDQRGGEIQIASIKFILEKEPITWQNIPIKLKRLMARLKSKIGL